MSIYADSSVFVSFYMNDAHSREARRRIAQPATLFLTPLHRAEWSNAVAQHVFRRQISAEQAQSFYQTLARDRKNGLWLEVDIPSAVIDTSVELADRYTPNFGTRTLDTLHVACALEFRAKEFWTFDERQAKLARAVGLQVA